MLSIYQDIQALGLVEETLLVADHYKTTAENTLVVIRHGEQFFAILLIVYKISGKRSLRHCYS